MEKSRVCDRSILLVEDDASIRRGLQTTLELEGYLVKAANNGKEALEILNSPEKPCVVLLDIMMPIMNGRELLDIIMKDVELAPIPVIILSAIAEKTHTIGAAAVVRKPFELGHVIGLIEGFCEHPAHK